MSEWECKTLGDFVELQRGYDLTAEERGSGNVPVVGAAGQNGFHNEARAKGPGIVVGRSGGSYGQVHFVADDFWPHNTAMYVTDFKGNFPHFAYYFLKNLDFAKLNSGSAQPSLNRNYVYPLKIRVPKPAEQLEIAAVLSALDAKIDLNNRINAELEALTKTIYENWFVQFDFPDANGKPYRSSGGKMVWSEALKQEVPKGWDVAALSSVVDVSTESLNPADKPDFVYKYVSIPELDKSGTYLLERGEAIGSNKFTVAKSDLLVSKLNPWFNRVFADTQPDDMICSTEFVVWRCKSAIMQAYLNSVATHEQFITYCKLAAAGTSNSHKRVNPQVMMRYKIPHSVQHAEGFGRFAAEILKRKILNSRQNSELCRLRDWLLPLLMNGQVRVRCATTAKSSDP